MEFFTTAVNQPGSLSYDCKRLFLFSFIVFTESVTVSTLTDQTTAYIVNHSKAYTLAAIASWVEFWIEYMIWGPRKVWWLVSALGVVLVLLGQVSTKVSTVHLSHNLTAHPVTLL